ncbi:MAG: hypothetical protein ABI183_27230 [Polyangiaceae bacterium]
MSEVARQRRKIFGLLTLGSFGLAFAASPFGCGLDDSALQQIGGADSSFSDTGVLLGGDGGQAIADSGSDAIACIPESCNNYPSVCRTGLDDGCGGKIDCLACPTDQKCIPDSGTCDGPPICHDAGEPGGNCETIINEGNGIEAGCGECSDNYTCTASTCQCASTVVCNGACCAASTNVCNASNDCCPPDSIATTCGNACNITKTNNCGMGVTCPATCGGPLQCAPNTKTCDTPPACPSMGQNGGSCGIITGSDGLTSNCGSTCSVTNETCSNNVCGCASPLCGTNCCASGAVCIAASSTCCTPNSVATTCNNKCGTVTNNCGQSIACPGNCGTGDICTGSSNCTCGAGGDTDTCNPGDKCCHGAHYYCHDDGKCN